MSSIRKLLFITTGITWIAMVVFMLQIPHDGEFGPGALAGLFGRIRQSKPNGHFDDRLGFVIVIE